MTGLIAAHELRPHNAIWYATTTQPGAEAAGPKRLAQGFHGRVLQGQEVLSVANPDPARACASRVRSLLIRLSICRTHMTAALRQPLLPSQPTPHKARSLLPWPNPTVWLYSSGWRAVIDDVQGSGSLSEATTAAPESFGVHRSCLDGQ